MKVILENFGPIKRVEFDLTKDLNVIFGKNNIGKSYAITALYIILKHLLAEFDESGSPLQYSFGRPRYYSRGAVESRAQQTLLLKISNEVRGAFRKKNDLQEYDLSENISSVLHDVFSSSLPELLSTSFNTSFQSVEQLTNGLTEKPLAITVESSHFSLLFSVLDNTIKLDKIKLKHPIIAKRSKINLKATINEHKTIIYFKVLPGKKSEQNDYLIADFEAISETIRIFSTVFSRELRKVTRAIYFLPASRSGLYQALSTFGALFAELSKSRNFVTKGISLPTISEPVADYFLRLSTMKPDADEGDAAIIARSIEQEILQGEVGFDEQTKKLFFFQNSINMQMDLSFASSMISEIAPIVAYFKYILRSESVPVRGVDNKGKPIIKRVRRLPASLIFIEEPEAHLHPEVQVKLMEFFARLTKHNVKVVMTSHSNYMFNKLSNLLLTNELEPDKVGSYLMRATLEGSVMDAFAMRAEEEGIADENFVDVAEQLYNERLQAYDKAGN